MNKPGFYKVVDSLVLYAPNYVQNQQYTLWANSHTSYTYPVDGWYWFDTETTAREFFNIPSPPAVDENIPRIIHGRN